MNVSLFITCLGDLFSGQVGMATVEVLEHFGCKVDFPAAQTCCGQPQFNNGFHPEAGELARRMVRVFADSPAIVSPSGSCISMIREHYPLLLKDDPEYAEKGKALAARTYELVEFLTRVLHVDLTGLSLPEPTRVTFHYTCHTRGLGMTAEPAIRLLKQLGNLEFVPLEKTEQCCGFGGTFATKYADISGAIVKDKVACGRATAAQVMIVNDSGCAMNISGACHRYGGQFQSRHIAELIAAAIRNQSNKNGPAGRTPQPEAAR